MSLNGELVSFFAQSTSPVPSDLIRIIAGYANENLPLALTNARRHLKQFSFENQQFLEPDHSALVFEAAQCQEEIGAIMCALTASPLDVDPVHKQIILNSFAAGGMQELVKICNEMGRIRQTLNLDWIKCSSARLTGPCNWNEISAIGADFRQVQFERLSMRGANFNESVFHSVTLVDVDLSHASMTGARWTEVDFRNVNIAGLNTGDERLRQYMADQQAKKTSSKTELILNGVLGHRSLILTAPASDRDCSVM
jgi:uncharacterized protein YjbI with pentapeptide repeats